MVKSAATIRDVARVAGVSVATVSRHLNGSSKILAETSERVVAAMKELNFEPSTSARNLAHRRTGSLGLLLSSISGDFFTPLLEGIEAWSVRAGYSVLTSSTTHWSPEGDRSPPLNPRNCDGLVVVEGTLPDAVLRRWAHEGFPLVVVYGHAPADTTIPAVVLDNSTSVVALVEHLHRVHGRRRFVHLAGTAGSTDATEREQAFRRAVADLPGTTASVLAGNFAIEHSELAVAALLASEGQGSHPDALVAADDESAVGALRALRAAGIRVPEDVSVTGFDDQRYASMLHPALTTVLSPSRDIGRAAVDLLVAQIGGRPVPALTRVPTTLQLRESCGCHPQNRPQGVS